MADVFNVAEKLLGSVRRVLSILKYGTREKALALLSALAFVGGGVLTHLGDIVPSQLKPALGPLQWVLFAIGAVLLLWLVLRLWKQAAPIEIPAVEVRPSAIKGPMAFGPQDGALFLKLERGQELSQLLNYVLDDQVPLVVLIGESGAGKTSLLRAGLSNVLKQRNIGCIYWEALPSNAGAALLHTVQAEWSSMSAGGKPADSPPVTLEELTDSLASRAVILDQLEQLDPTNEAHAAIFKLLLRVNRGLRPCRVTWIVAFRREFDPVWRDLELANPDFHPPMLSLKLFGEQPARRIMATLAESAGLIPDEALVTDLLRAARRKEGISPVDIGVGLLVLSELAAGKGQPHLSMDDYRFAGGAEGLLTHYLQERVSRFADFERTATMKALLDLVDLETDQRLAEGRTLDDLAARSGIGAAQLRSCLDYLASPQVRLLETSSVRPGAAKTYRLPHERIIPALRQLTGTLLAKAEQARLAFETTFRVWNRNRTSRYLLSGAELATAVKLKEQILRYDEPEQKGEYLRLSLRRRTRERMVAVAFLVLLVVFSVLGLRLNEQNKYREYLRDCGLPADLYDHQAQLRRLETSQPITHLRWVTGPLVDLSIVNGSFTRLEGLPKTLITLRLYRSSITSFVGLKNLPALTTLNLNGTQITSLLGLEKLPVLTTLDLSSTQITSLVGLEKLPALTTLNLAGTQITSLVGLEKLPTLTTLSLAGTQITSLVGLEKLPALTTLNLSDTQITSLAGLEKLPALTTLRLWGTKITSLTGLDKLPALTTLDLSGTSLAGLEKLRALTTLRLWGTKITSLTGLEKLPALRTLDLRGSGIRSLAGLEKLPVLTTLDLSSTQITSLVGLEKLPALTTLNLAGTQITSLVGLEKLPTLTTLSLAGTQITSLVGLEKLPALTTLNLSDTQITSLAGLEKLPALTALDLGGAKNTNLAGLEKLRVLTTLNLSGTGITSLADLEKLSGLTTLNLSGTGITSLAGLEKLSGLTTLSLSGTGITSLTGLEILPALTTLNLSGKQITSLAGLEKLPALTTLNLNGAQITNLVGVEKLGDLKSIRLEDCKMESLKGLPKSVSELSF